MILSGSHTPGVSASDFHLPPRTALRYERPAEAISRHVTSYVVMDSDPIDADGIADWMLPSWAQIWIVFSNGPVTVGIGNRSYPELPTAALFGPTSRAMPVQSYGGAAIVIDVSPLGWARLIGQRADALADRIVPLDQILPPEHVLELTSALQRSDRDLQVKSILDDFLSERLATPHPEEELIEALMAAIMDDATRDAAAAARRLGIDRRKVADIARRHFGFTTTTLLLRARFLKAMLPKIGIASDGRVEKVPARYHDASHFNRDGRRFLGTTPRRFLQLDKPYCEAAMRARVLVLGSALSALDWQ